MQTMLIQKRIKLTRCPDYNALVEERDEMWLDLISSKIDAVVYENSTEFRADFK